MTTMLYYPPIYDGHGNNLNPDRNTTHSPVRCSTCGKKWDAGNVDAPCRSVYRFRKFEISDRMLPRLQGYTEFHRPVGDFLMAVLSNDLRGACQRADDENIENLPAYVAYLYNEAPGACWGSPEKVKEWLDLSKWGIAP